MQTEAAWFCYQPEMLSRFEEQLLDAAAGLQGVANVLTNVVPLYVLCDPRDVGVVPSLRDPHTSVPTIFVYDKYPGGTGLARKVFETYATIFQAALELVEQCQCSDGCPSCVGPPLELGRGAKTAARLWLEAAVRGLG
jgi:DEAD/DEAH box helicase domain-containing protein